MISNIHSRKIVQRDLTIGTHQSWISGRYPIPRNGLVWEWLLNGDALDTSWSGNNGTATNMTYDSTDRGYQSQMGVFNGSNAYISWLIATPSTHSICFWFKTSASGSNYTFNDNSALSILAWNSAGKIQYDDWVDEVLTTTNTYVDGNWHFCVCARANWTTNGSFINVDNGTEITTWTISSSVGGSIDLWHRKSPSQQFWTWNLQLVRIYNQVLSAKEINNLYMEWLKLLH